MTKAASRSKDPSVARHRTAITRVSLSRPVRLALEAGLIDSDTTFLDYGCGRGDDLRSMKAVASACYGWDPVHRPKGELREAHVVNLGYVVNVIEDPAERRDVLHDAWGYASRALLVSARLDHEAKGVQLSPHRDGALTGSGTFQKFFNQHELREWIDTTLGVNSVAAAPGVFFVFCDEALRESFAASRFRRRAAVPDQRLSDLLFDQHKELLQPLMGFYASRGRPPTDAELAEAPQIVDAFGSLRRAFAVVRRVTGPGQWDQIEQERAQDLSVYVALSQFAGRPRFSALPDDMQLDIKAFFGAYTRACEQADELLFSAGDVDAVSQACAQAACGKATREALYVHVDALPALAPILRIYEGCARAYFGHVDGANVIKLNRQRPQISYLWYPDFDSDPHPALTECLVVNLRGLEVTHRDYGDSPNPPILHRKEEFLAPDDDRRPKFERLTLQEERRGLYENPAVIGTRERWDALLEEKGLRLRGHQLVKQERTATA